MFGIPNRLMALAVLPALAFTLFACGPKPEPTPTTPPPPAGGEPTPAATSPAPPPGGETSPPASPGAAVVSEEIVAFVEGLPAAKGKDGKLSVNAAEGVMLVEIVQVDKAAATKTPDGKNNVPAKLKNDKGVEIAGEFMVVGETKDTATVDGLVVIQDGNRTTYIWSEETMAFVPGPAGAPGGSPAPGGDAGASPAPGGDAAAPAPGADAAAPAPGADAAAPAPGETPAATH